MSEDNKTKKITVTEIKALEPLADIYQFNSYNRYMVVLKKSNLVGGNELVKQKAEAIYRMLQQSGIPAMILVGGDDDLKIFEVK